VWLRLGPHRSYEFGLTFHSCLSEWWIRSYGGYSQVVKNLTVDIEGRVAWHNAPSFGTRPFVD